MNFFVIAEWILLHLQELIHGVTSRTGKTQALYENESFLKFKFLETQPSILEIQQSLSFGKYIGAKSG